MWIGERSICLINMDDKQRLREWADRNSDNSVFSKMLESDADSFWCMRDENMEELIKYDFRTLPEFEALCQDIVRYKMDVEITKMVAVSAFKSKPRFEESINVKEMEKEPLSKLPEYIYVF